ncbi:MAG: lysoplasmalogenase [Rhodothermales bacterium]
MNAPLVLLSIAVLGTALLELRAEVTGPRTRVYVFKPLTTTLIIVLALLAPEPVSPLYHIAIVVGLVFSLGGDVFLMLPSDRFVAGLVSFLGAHVCYLVAFTSEAGFVFSIWSLLPFLLFGVLLFRVLWPHVGTLRLPVLVYGVVILLMGWQAFEYWHQTGTTDSLLAFLGAVLFVLSDAVLAINRFVKPLKAARVVIMSTYYTAQWLIALSV